MGFHSSLNTAVSLQEPGRNIHLCTNKTRDSRKPNTLHGSLWLCSHCLFKGSWGGDGTPPPLPARAAPLIAVTALLNTRIHSDSVFNCNSSQFSDIHKLWFLGSTKEFQAVGTFKYQFLQSSRWALKRSK